MSPWVETHRPTCFQEIKGQAEAIRKVVSFINTFPSNKKAILLHGGPGTGKTTLALVAALETDAEIFELNASDFRSKTKLQERLKPALEQQSLLKNKKIILVDEADGISGLQDYGGIPELLRLIQNSPFPVILTANDAWSKKLSDLRKKVELVELKGLEQEPIVGVLQCILDKEKIQVNQNILKSIALRSKGDIRAAINDLQSIARLQDPSIFTLDERDKEIDIFSAMKMVFKEKPSKETSRIYDQVNLELDQIFLWVEENIPNEYKGKALERAFDLLSKADVFRGRIYKQQYWRFLVYENLFLSYGVSTAKNLEKINSSFTSYKRPARILKIWLNNQRTAKKKSISEKYSKLAHIGTKRAMHEFPVIKQIIKSHPNIAEELKLSQDEIDYVNKEIVSTNMSY